MANAATVGVSAPSYSGYAKGFYLALLAASVLPALALVIDFEITNNQIYALTASLSVFLFFSATHTWITLAYYFDRRWRELFNRQALALYLAPAAILVLGTTLVTQVFYRPLGALVIYAAFTINMWHHAKQNWGVFSLIGKSRGVNVASMRLLLTTAWLFFLPVLSVNWPDVNHWRVFPFLDPLRPILGPVLPYFQPLTVLTVCAYGAWFAYAVVKSQVWRDLPTLAFALILALYFVPMLTLADKPYGLLLFKHAHGAQYYLLVTMSLSLAGRTASNWSVTTATVVKTAWIVVALLVITALGSGTLAVSMEGYGPGYVVRFATGLMASVSLAHFWVDRFIWKMSEKDVRKLHGGAFAF